MPFGSLGESKIDSTYNEGQHEQAMREALGFMCEAGDGDAIAK